ncbi:MULTISPECIES: helix-turn-helix domain-containing protein [Bacillus]|uniref:helix-turn-helix domain-containing protein n=1 Tax=Bacillus TaxID=1386 RepID=UPI000BF62055|nr:MULTISPECIES: helix-turn-helix transcriptional regulator [Bacillus]AXR17931.1 XRE family transcriptional regulator [Bacillus sp. CR71]AXR23664.1 XRE family transcriptional regulator [Bacillus sp. E25]PFX65851.1 transcriptional regulator [Bacillus cereus]WLP66998.1 helix-turn-helix transcriptional regulator [Bacillus thuringiensis]
MFGLGKKRTPFGKYLDHRGIKQQWLVQRTGLSKSLISDLANKKDRIPTLTSATKIIRILKKFDKHIDYQDFWNIDI